MGSRYGAYSMDRLEREKTTIFDLTLWSVRVYCKGKRFTTVGRGVKYYICFWPVKARNDKNYGRCFAARALRPLLNSFSTQMHGLDCYCIYDRTGKYANGTPILINNK